MQLYHYTYFEWAMLIQQQGIIKTTESNLSLTREHAGPDVVWLTAADSWEPQGWMERMEVKTGVRFIVDVPDDEVWKWEHFAIRYNMRRRYVEALKATDSNWRSWYVLPRPITAGEIIGLECNPNGVPVQVEPSTNRLRFTDIELPAA
jgi:hypothetical protein